MSERQLTAPSLVDVLCATLRTDILEGRVPTGTALTELSVAAEFSVARPTAKAAIERLTQEGLLRRDFNKTAQVPQLGEADIRDLYRSRGFIEREVVRELASTGTVPEAAREAHVAYQTLAVEGGALALVEADIRLHVALLESLESPRLTKMYTTLMGEMRLCMAQVQSEGLLQPELIASRHEKMLAAIESRNVEEAVDHITDHLQRACDRLIAEKRLKNDQPS